MLIFVVDSSQRRSASSFEVIIVRCNDYKEATVDEIHYFLYYNYILANAIPKTVISTNLVCLLGELVCLENALFYDHQSGQTRWKNWIATFDAAAFA